MIWPDDKTGPSNNDQKQKIARRIKCECLYIKLYVVATIEHSYIWIWDNNFNYTIKVFLAV